MDEWIEWTLSPSFVGDSNGRTPMERKKERAIFFSSLVSVSKGEEGGKTRSSLVPFSYHTH